MKAGESHVRLKPVRAEGERRAEPRLAVRLHTELLDLEGEAVAAGTTEDVGAGGLFVRSEFLEPEGTPVRLAVRIGREVLTLDGHVAWVSDEGQGAGMGIRVAEGDARARLRLYLATLAKAG